MKLWNRILNLFRHECVCSGDPDAPYRSGLHDPNGLLQIPEKLGIQYDWDYE